MRFFHLLFIIWLFLLTYKGGCDEKLFDPDFSAPNKVQKSSEFRIVPEDYKITADKRYFPIPIKVLGSSEILEWSSSDNVLKIKNISKTIINLDLDEAALNKNAGSEFDVIITVLDLVNSKTKTAKIRLLIPSSDQPSAADCNSAVINVSPSSGVSNAEVLISIIDPDVDSESMVADITYPSGDSIQKITLSKDPDIKGYYGKTERLGCNSCVAGDQIEISYKDESSNECLPGNVVFRYRVIR